jgi:hypothetical protein
MRWWLMPLPSCAVICHDCKSKHSLLMSSPDFINIPAKQSPVINRLHDCMTQAAAYAAAIRDNAQDDGQPIPLELVASFEDDYNKIIASLHEAHHLAS